MPLTRPSTASLPTSAPIPGGISIRSRYVIDISVHDASNMFSFLRIRLSFCCCCSSGCRALSVPCSTCVELHNKEARADRRRRRRSSSSPLFFLRTERELGSGTAAREREREHQLRASFTNDDLVPVMFVSKYGLMIRFFVYSLHSSFVCVNAAAKEGKRQVECWSLFAAKNYSGSGMISRSRFDSVQQRQGDCLDFFSGRHWIGKKRLNVEVHFTADLVFHLYAHGASSAVAAGVL